MKDLAYQVQSPSPRDEWHEIMDKDPHALVSQSPEWVDALCESGNYVDASRIYEFASGNKFLLPLVRNKHTPSFLSSLASFPSSWGFGGFLGKAMPTTPEINLIVEDLLQMPEMRIMIRPNPLLNGAWNFPERKGVLEIPRLAHVIDLAGGFSHIWSKVFKSSTRTKIRKAESGGLEVKCNTTGEYLPVFFELFNASVKRWAGMQNEPLWLAQFRAKRRDSLKKFALLSKHLGDALRVWVAWYRNEPAAAIIVLQGTNAHYTRGAMNKALAGPTRANDLLQKLAIEDACNAGCRYYHMGESGSSDSLAQFKRRFGGVAHSYSELRIERFPITKIDQKIRTIIKRTIGFKDA
jgi:hypothetical protein